MGTNAILHQNRAWLLATCLLMTGTFAMAEAAGTVVLGDRMWASTAISEDLPWADADRHCRSLTLEGHNDWRLPTLVELEGIADAEAEGGIAAPIELHSCCAWSRTSLAERPADGGGDPGGAPSQYYWGLLFDSGTPYYSFQRFPDGRALCVRDAD